MMTCRAEAWPSLGFTESDHHIAPSPNHKIAKRLMHDPESPQSLLTPRKMILQIAGWLIGLGLLYLIIRGAMQKDWTPIKRADPRLVAALLGCTLISTMLNGTTFWITIQPLRKLRWIDMQLL